MKVKIGFILMAAVSLTLAAAGLTFAQDTAVGQQQPAQTPASASDSEIQWLWGEVVSVDNQKNEMVVKYLDYESDTEKEMNIATGDKTTYENVKSLLEVSPKDTVSVDYTVGADGKSIAKNISVEKPETESAAQQSTPAVVPPVEQKAAPAAADTGASNTGSTGSSTGSAQ